MEKRTSSGDLIFRLGERGKPTAWQEGAPFNRPTDIVVHPESGDFFVSDGYGNSRVNQELQEQLRQQVEDQEQMIAFLKRKNQEQAEQYVDLEEKLMALQQAKESEKERLEQQITQMKEDSQRALDQVLAPPTPRTAPIQTLLHRREVEISDPFLLFSGEEGLGMNVGTCRVGIFPVLHITSLDPIPFFLA